MAIRKLARLLLVDDDPGLLSYWACAWSAEGYSVVTAEGAGRKRCACWGVRKWILVISDLRMDEMDGLQLFSEIQKGHPGHAGDHSHRSRFDSRRRGATQQGCSAS
ncbi:response regulator [Klebsiella pneumoniae subsp. pneumoniae]|nr:response regulator [Klebsiella pneumoniae subsp. pneumoniae]